MDRIPRTRFLLLLFGGLALGYTAALVADSVSASPLCSPVVVAIGAVFVGIWLRRYEFLNLVVESGVYAYCAYLGVALVRVMAPHNRVATMLKLSWSADLTPVILLVGIGFAAAVVFLIAMPAWMIAGRVSEPRHTDAREFWSFVETHLVNEREDPRKRKTPT